MKRKEIIICILALITLGMTISNVFATNTDTIPLANMNNETKTINDILGSNTNISNTNSMTTIQQTNQITNQITNQTTNNITNSTSNVSNSPNQLVNTGLEETSFIAIIICVLSAVFTYNKIKKYNF